MEEVTTRRAVPLAVAVPIGPEEPVPLSAHVYEVPLAAETAARGSESPPPVRLHSHDGGSGGVVKSDTPPDNSLASPVAAAADHSSVLVHVVPARAAPVARGQSGSDGRGGHASSLSPTASDPRMLG